MTTTAIAKSWSQLVPKDIAEAKQYAEMIASSGMVPKDFIGQPNKVLVAIQMGDEVGLKPMQALQNIAVINGRPCIWGDAVPGLIWGSGKCDYIKEWLDENGTAHCEAKRKDSKAIFINEFSIEDAKIAHLWGKQGPWTNYPKRMLKLRARGFTARDGFSDVLKGLGIAEEQRDVIDVEAIRTPEGPEALTAPQEKPQASAPAADSPQGAKTEEKKPEPKAEPKAQPKPEMYKGKVEEARQVGKGKAAVFEVHMDDGNVYCTVSKSWYEAAKKSAGFDEEAQVTYISVSSDGGVVRELKGFARVKK